MALDISHEKLLKQLIQEQEKTNLILEKIEQSSDVYSKSTTFFSIMVIGISLINISLTITNDFSRKICMLGGYICIVIGIIYSQLDRLKNIIK